MRFSETELPGRFDGVKKDGTPYADQYQILIVAEKYQTGFDQPKLCAMYVDHKLAGLQAVQTLSRLNRTRQGKDKTFVLDFQNSIEDIQNAFRPYFEVTALEANSDPNQVYDLEGRLFKFGYLDKDEIERFAATFFKGPLDGFDRARLEALVRAAVARFETDEDEGRQEEFRQLLRSYLRFYGFIAQVVRLADTGLEKLIGLWCVAGPAAAEPGGAAGHRNHRGHAAPAGVQGGEQGGRQCLAWRRATRRCWNRSPSSARSPTPRTNRRSSRRSSRRSTSATARTSPRPT